MASGKTGTRESTAQGAGGGAWVKPRTRGPPPREEPRLLGPWFRGGGGQDSEKDLLK